MEALVDPEALKLERAKLAMEEYKVRK